jgi:hypothetical protein
MLAIMRVASQKAVAHSIVISSQRNWAGPRRQTQRQHDVDKRNVSVADSALGA